jgi:mRNA interferase HigB
VLIVGREIIAVFVKKHASAKKPLDAWVNLASESKWKGPSCVKRDFPSASFLSGNRVVFNIGGNKFRMIVTAVFCKERILIKRIGTHAEYDRWKL